MQQHTKKWLRDRTDEALKSGLPIFVSESAGMEASGDGKINYQSWQEYISWMEERGIIGLFGRFQIKMKLAPFLKNLLIPKEIGKLRILKESGQKTRNTLDFIIKVKTNKNPEFDWDFYFFSFCCNHLLFLRCHLRRSTSSLHFYKDKRVFSHIFYTVFCCKWNKRCFAVMVDFIFAV